MRVPVRVIAEWSSFYGWRGEIVASAGDGFLVLFPGEKKPLRFGFESLEVESLHAS